LLKEDLGSYCFTLLKMKCCQWSN